MGVSADLGILGGGVSGLSLGYLFPGRSEVLEKEDSVGGHCRSCERDGFRYDEGGHILFSRNADVLKRMVDVLGENVQKHFRSNKIWFKGRFVKYPFENGLGDLEKEDAFECLYHYLYNDAPKPQNFLEWIFHAFGRGIAERYLIPYNEKLWKVSLDQISLDWIGGRVPRPPAEDVIKSALGIPTEGYTHQLFFYYPKRGGFGALPRALAEAAKERLSVLTQFEVRRVWRQGARWVVSDGHRERAYERLVCTMPIHSLLSALEEVPSAVVDAGRNLKCNPSIIVLVGLNKCAVRDVVAVYFPQPELVFNRVCFYHVYGGDNVPPGKYAAVAEISTPGEAGQWNEQDHTIAQHTVRDMATAGLIREGDVITTDVHRVRYSYVVYDHNYRKSVETIRSFVRSLGIELLGRFAEWEYINSDQCFERALKLAGRLSATLSRESE